MILDTNTYTALRRNDAAILDVVKYAKTLCLPFCVVAELKFGFANGSRQSSNDRILTDFLTSPHVSVLYPGSDTVRSYAELAAYCRTRGRSLSHNDLWIAALVQDTNQTLVTYDRDFEVLTELFGDKLVLLEY